MEGGKLSSPSRWMVGETKLERPLPPLARGSQRDVKDCVWVSHLRCLPVLLSFWTVPRRETDGMGRKGQEHRYVVMVCLREGGATRRLDARVRSVSTPSCIHTQTTNLSRHETGNESRRADAWYAIQKGREEDDQSDASTCTLLDLEARGEGWGIDQPPEARVIELRNQKEAKDLHLDELPPPPPVFSLLSGESIQSLLTPPPPLLLSLKSTSSCLRSFSFLVLSLRSPLLCLSRRSASLLADEPLPEPRSNADVRSGLAGGGRS